MGNRPGPESGCSHRDWQLLPVVGVTWPGTQAFIEKLNAKDSQHQQGKCGL